MSKNKRYDKEFENKVIEQINKLYTTTRKKVFSISYNIT